MEAQKSESGAPCVLVVDDSEPLLEVLREVLTTHGFDVIATNSAAEAFEILKRERPDVILCDIMMPGIDGFTFNTKVREQSELCDIPFVFLTALSEPDDVRHGKNHGCDDYLTKPFDPLDLAAVLHGKVRLARSRAGQSEERFERYRKRIIHTLSHEFRTPLVAINTGAELLLDQHSRLDDKHLTKLLESIHRGGLRMQRLVEDFMTLQQIESGSAAMMAERLKRNVSLKTLLEESIEAFHESGHEPALPIELIDRSEGKSVIVRACDIQIGSILQRIFSNAQKFGPKGEKVTATITADDQTASVVIRDKGPGLSDEVIKRACEMFAQIDRERQEQQGCGLGLTIAMYYAEINNAKLLFRPPVDGGAGLEAELQLFRHV